MVFVIPDTISEGELLKILKVSKSHHRAAFILAFYGCMRVSEVVKLQKEDIDRGQRLIKIKQAKGCKDRNIPIPPQAVRALSHFPLSCGVRALQIAIKSKGIKVLGKNIHFHTLRHSGASWYINVKGWSTRQVQQLLGHSKVQTTEIYTHVTPKDLINKMWEDDK